MRFDAHINIPVKNREVLVSDKYIVSRFFGNCRQMALLTTFWPKGSILIKQPC